MTHVICTLPNAGAEISGVAFKDHVHEGEAAKITVEPVSDEVALGFLAIAGYVEAPKASEPVAAKAAKPEKAAE